MRCPECEAETAVVDSRKVEGTTRRRRECLEGHRFTTEESVVVLVEPREVKTVSMVEPWAERILRSLDCVGVEGCKSAGEVTSV